MVTKIFIMIIIVSIIITPNILWGADLSNLTLQTQQYEKWCWVACSNMIHNAFAYFCYYQCSQVKEAHDLGYTSGITDGCPATFVPSCCGLYILTCAFCGLKLDYTTNWLEYRGFTVEEILRAMTYNEVFEATMVNGYPIYMTIVIGDKGHTCVIGGALDVDNIEMIRVLDPAGTDDWWLYEDVVNSSWTESRKIKSLTITTGLEDIQSFQSAYPPDCDPITMEYQIASIDTLALYVSDRGWGPARFVKKWLPTGNSGEVSHFGSCTEFVSEYAFYLVHGYRWYYPDMVSTEYGELYPNLNNLFQKCGQYDTRPIVAPPTNLTVEDVPFDDGGEVILSWDLSTQENLVSWYNIYYGPPNDVKWRGTELTGTSSRTIQVDPGVTTRFCVSSAHHTVCDIEGLWNDFSEYVEGSSINNYAFMELTLLSNDTLIVCPAGDADIVRVQLTILGSDSLPTQDVPPESMLLFVLQDSLYHCKSDTIIASNYTCESGETDFTFRDVGGHGQMKLVATVNGIPVFDTLTVIIKSPDYIPNGNVGITDFSLFGAAYPSICADSTYNEWFDFNDDCQVGLVDFVRFGDHWNHLCQEGGGGDE